MIPYALPNIDGSVITVTTTAQTLSELISVASSENFNVPAFLDAIDLNVSGNIRIAIDGLIPTSAKGFLLPAGVYKLRGLSLTQLRLISVSGTVDVDIQIGRASEGEADVINIQSGGTFNGGIVANATTFNGGVNFANDTLVGFAGTVASPVSAFRADTAQTQLLLGLGGALGKQLVICDIEHIDKNFDLPNIGDNVLLFAYGDPDLNPTLQGGWYHNNEAMLFVSKGSPLQFFQGIWSRGFRLEPPVEFTRVNDTPVTIMTRTVTERHTLTYEIEVVAQNQAGTKSFNQVLRVTVARAPAGSARIVGTPTSLYLADEFDAIPGDRVLVSVSGNDLVVQFVSLAAESVKLTVYPMRKLQRHEI